MNAVDIIRAKRDGGRLTDEQIDWFINAYTNGLVADEQAAALCMAIVWRGMEPTELARWTNAMVASGEHLDLSGIGRPTVDKHSTGGVGDKVSLILVPMLAACGAAVPKLSGRGLGYTGGTLDKLESIPGWSAHLTTDRMIEILSNEGAVIAAAGDGLAPADHKLYALRDVTGTVQSIPLIASSIMAKKIAAGTTSLVLDITVGTGANIKNIGSGRELAHVMVALGEAAGVATTALLTDMNTPLGRAAGNALEVTEAIEVLQGGGPADLIEVTLALADEVVALAGLDAEPSRTLEDGSAMDAWHVMIRAQGGDPDAELAHAKEVEFVTAPSSGHLVELDALAVGIAAWSLGAGRARQEDPISAAAGVVCLAKPGDRVDASQPILELHTDDADRIASAVDALQGAIEVEPIEPEARTLVLDRITA